MSTVRALPLWVRYVCTFTVAAGLFLALVLFVHGHNGPLVESAANPSASQARAEAVQNYELAVQQEAPQQVALPRGAAPQAGAVAAISAFFSRQVRSGFLTGSIDGPARCASAGARPDGGRTFACDEFTGQGDNQLRYPFRAVVHPSAGRVTFCRIVTPAYPSYPADTVPVPSACR